MAALVTNPNSITTLIVACLLLFAYWLYVKVQQLKKNRVIILEQKKQRVKELQNALDKWQKIKSDDKRAKRQLPRGRVKVPAIQ